MHNVVITGGAGFVGHHLVKKLIARNCKISIVDNLTNSNKEFLSEFAGEKYRQGHILSYNKDIRDKEALLSLFKREKIDTCIHLAAKTDVKESMVNPLETIDINVKGTLNILEACYKNNVENFVYISSAAVYGQPTYSPVSEEVLPEPISPYGASKVAGEALVSSYKSRLKNVTSLRLFNIYGRGQNSSYAGVITKFIERLTKGLPPLIYGDGLQTRDFISVDDVVSAIILACEKRSLDSSSCLDTCKHIFNVGTGRPTTILNLALMLLDIFKVGDRVRPIHLEPIDGDIIHSCAETTRAKHILKFTAEEDLRTGLEKLIKT